MRLLSFACEGCRTDFRIVSEDGDAHHAELLIQQPRLCPLCQQQFITPCFVGRHQYEVHPITLKDLWLAVNGMGLPSEREFDSAEVIKLLTTHAVVRAEATMKRAGRVSIRQLTLDNGSSLHFGDGAVIYKIEENQDGRRRQRVRNEDSPSGGEEHFAGGDAGPVAPVAEDGQAR